MWPHPVRLPSPIRGCSGCYCRCSVGFLCPMRPDWEAMGESLAETLAGGQACLAPSNSAQILTLGREEKKGSCTHPSPDAGAAAEEAPARRGLVVYVGMTLGGVSGNGDPRVARLRGALQR